MSEQTRAWIYRAAVAIIAIAGVYHLVNPDQAAAWVNAAAAIAGLGSAGLAAGHTSTKRAKDTA